MNLNEYQTLADFEGSYWWHLGRLSVLRRQLQKAVRNPTTCRILNVGAGTGGTVSTLAAFGTVDHVDISDEAIRFLQEHHVERVVKADGTSLPFPNDTFDVIVATDVLEHIQDDSAALREWRRVLRPGGKIIITVPAYQWLWSEHDESLNHFRRYTASGLHILCNQNHLSVYSRTYIITFCFPLIVAYRAIRHFFNTKHSTSYVRLPKWVNFIFTKIVEAEGAIVQFVNLPFGTSVLLVVKK